MYGDSPRARDFDQLIQRMGGIECAIPSMSQRLVDESVELERRQQEERSRAVDSESRSTSLCTAKLSNTVNCAIAVDTRWSEESRASCEVVKHMQYGEVARGIKARDLLMLGRS